MPRDKWITLIGLGKLVKSAVLIVAGVVLVTGGGDNLQRRTHALGLRPGTAPIHRALERFAGLDRHALARLGVGLFLYATLFMIEGSGLLARKRWAEYFTIIITGSFVPLELYEIAQHPSSPKLVGALLNIAAVAYLVWHLVRGRRA